MHFLYVLYSDKIDRFYIGESTGVEERLHQHNNGQYKYSFTKAAGDWQLKLKYETANRSEAIFLEKFIKRMKSRKFIEKITAKPDILEDILHKKNGRKN